MALKIYNSLTREKETFQPLTPGQASLYACGPTVYDEPHIGHLRSAYFFDMIRAYFEYSGYRFRFVRNVTDIDDKIIEKARQSGGQNLVLEVQKVSQIYFEKYKNDLARLGLRDPDEEPRATSHVGAMLQLIQRLIAKGVAYESGGDVYFEVKAFKGYGRLSHQDQDAMKSHVRIDKNEKKRDDLDFALWKRAGTDEPGWDSPWGRGRPGWHIECSAMSMQYLGESFDLHGGGIDLIFPHHENEIAQSESATGRPFVRAWLHHGLVTVDQQKMSKSLKNYVTVSHILQSGGEELGLEALRLFFLGTHYRAPLDYSAEQMKMELSVAKRFFFFFEETRQVKGIAAKGKFADFEAAFRAAMDDDFNTPKVLTLMHELMREARKKADSGTLLAARDLLKRWGALFHLFDHDRLLERPADASLEEDIRKRREARKAKEFKAADDIRSRLLARGIALTDLEDGSTIWRCEID